MLTRPCSTSLKPMVGAGSSDACPPSGINSTAASPVNAARLVQLANVAIDSHENALDCRVDSASLAQNGDSDGIKSEDGAGQSCDAVGRSLASVTDAHTSRGKSVYIIKYMCCPMGAMDHNLWGDRSFAVDSP